MYDASDLPDTALTCPCGLVGLSGLLTLLDCLLSRPCWHGGLMALVGHLGSSLGGVYGLSMSDFIFACTICADLSCCQLARSYQLGLSHDVHRSLCHPYHLVPHSSCCLQHRSSTSNHPQHLPVHPTCPTGLLVLYLNSVRSFQWCTHPPDFWCIPHHIRCHLQPFCISNHPGRLQTQLFTIWPPSLVCRLCRFISTPHAFPSPEAHPIAPEAHLIAFGLIDNLSMVRFSFGATCLTRTLWAPGGQSRHGPRREMARVRGCARAMACEGKSVCKGVQGRATVRAAVCKMEGRMYEGEGMWRWEGVQGHAMVMVMRCDVGRMCKGMQGWRQGRLSVFYSNICISYQVSGIVVDLLHTNTGNPKHCIKFQGVFKHSPKRKYTWQLCSMRPTQLQPRQPKYMLALAQVPPYSPLTF